MADKLCPLQYDQEEKLLGGCWKEKCAWWDDVEKHCSIFLIQERLSSIWNLYYETIKVKGLF